MDQMKMYENNSSAMLNSSNTTYDDIDCSNQYAGPGLLKSPYFRVFVTVMYSAIFFVALIGNGAVCFIVRAFPRMRTVTNYFIANLALGDILMSVFCVPFSFVALLLLNNWPFGSMLCRLVNYSQVVSVLVSAYTLVALAADRYRTIMAPLRPRLTKLKAKVAIAAVWVGALGTALPVAIVSALVKPSEWHVKCDKTICQESWPHNEQMYYYSMAMMMLQFAIPLTVLVFTYARIAVAVWGGRPPGEAENSRDERMAKSKRKMVKMMVTVVIVFIVCWLPFNILIIMWTLDIDDDSWNVWAPLPYVWFAFHWLAMSHSCYNPIIYCYMSARFRYSFIQVAAKFPCLRNCLGAAVERAQRGDLHNGVSGVGMTKTTLHRVNTCSSYVSIRKRVSRCSCSPARSSCSPARSTCSHTRSTCSSNLTTMSQGKNADSPCLMKKGTCISHGQNSLSPLINVCSSEVCINKIDSDNSEIILDGDSYSEGFHNSRNRISRNNGCTERARESPARAASLLTTQGTICSNDRRHVTYMEDQI